MVDITNLDCLPLWVQNFLIKICIDSVTLHKDKKTSRLAITLKFTISF